MPFGSCGLCLEIARDPVSCQRGDIFCRECALANILAQKKEMKRAEKAKKMAELEQAKMQAVNDDEDHRRAVRDFELTQAGFSGSRAALTSDKPESTDEILKFTGAKRKFELDADELDRIAKEDRAKARKAIEDEKVRLKQAREEAFAVHYLCKPMRLIKNAGRKSVVTVILDPVFNTGRHERNQAPGSVEKSETSCCLSRLRNRQPALFDDATSHHY